MVYGRHKRIEMRDFVFNAVETSDYYEFPLLFEV